MAFIVVAGCASNAQKIKVTLKELPTAAQAFLSSNFPNQAISYAVKDIDFGETEFKVLLSGGTEIEFDSNGNWQEIDGNKNALPPTVLPKSIAEYATQNYSGNAVIQIEKDTKGYEVELANGYELDFDNNGKFLRLHK